LFVERQPTVPETPRTKASNHGPAGKRIG
jgi:hypothetical protein